MNKEQRLQKNLRETLEKMMRDQSAEMNALQEEFGNGPKLMDSKYKMLTENFKELE